jgi:putative ABC transport system permease protein
LAAFSIRDRLFSSAPALLKGAVAILISAWIVVLLAGSSWKPGGFILGIAVLMALPMSAPWLLITLAGRVTIKDFGFRFALRTLADRIHNTVFPISALAIAVSMLVGITLMIGSFRETVKVWIETTVVADLYATARSWRGAGSEGGFDEATVRRFAAREGVAAVDRIRTIPVYVDGNRILVSGVDLHSSESRRRYPLLHGDPGRAFGELEGGDAVLISEPLARKRSL